MLPIQAGLVETNLVHALAVGVAIFSLTVPISLLVAARARQPWLVGLVLGSLGLHFLGSLLQVVVVRVVYENSADFHLYNGQGRELSAAWLSGDLLLPDRDIPGTGAVSLVTAVVYSVFGVDQLGGFFVFSWFAVLGCLGFYQAFRTAMPHACQSRYAAMLFLLPSMWYWPSVAGKEAIMMLALGGIAWGAARLLAGEWQGVIPALAGTILGGLVRPHEVALLFGAFSLALLFRHRERRSLLSPVQWVLTLLIIGALGAAMTWFTARYLGITTLSSQAIVQVMNEANENLQGDGAGYGSSYSEWRPSPLYFPYDVVLVLLKPLPWEVSSMNQTIAMLENLSLVALFALSWRSIASVPGALWRSPFLLMCSSYSVVFIYLFSALGNVGLLVRERTLLFPFLFVLLAIRPWGFRRTTASPALVPVQSTQRDGR